MKTISFLLVSLLLFSCALFNNEDNKTIQFLIQNKSISKKDTIKLKIVNNSNKNYYLPILNNDLCNKYHFHVAGSVSSLLFIYNGIKTEKGIEKLWFSDNCNYNADLEELDKKFENFKNNISIKDIVLLKPKKSIVIKIPFDLVIFSTNNCTWTIKDINENEKYKLYLFYNKNSQAVADAILNKSLLNSLKEIGYELYGKEIISNKVPLILEKE